MALKNGDASYIKPVELVVNNKGQPTDLIAEIGATSPEAAEATLKLLNDMGLAAEPIARKTSKSVSMAGLGDNYDRIDWSKKPKGDVRNN